MDKVKFKCEIDTLITMCHVVDDFENFRNNTSKFIEDNGNYDIMWGLTAVTNGHSFRGSGKLEKFYKENKKVVDEIQKHMVIGNFIATFCISGAIDNEFSDKIYDYVRKNKCHIDKILLVLERLKELGLDRINYDESLDFTIDEYNLYMQNLNNTYRIVYIENAMEIPTYNIDRLEYKTKKSPYRIIVWKEITCDIPTIELNSLVFNPNRLPKEVTIEYLYNQLAKLKDNQGDIFLPIRNIADLTDCLNDLINRYEVISTIIEKEEDVDVKEQLKKELEIIKSSLLRIKELNANHCIDVIDTNNIPTSRLPESIQKVYSIKTEFNA